MSRKRFFLPALVALTAFFTLAAMATALADNVIADGDGLAPLTSNGVAFGNVCKTANPHPQKTVLLAINKVGGGNVYANSATVAVSATSVTGSGLSATSGGNITLASSWTSLRNGTLSSTVSSTVTLDPSSLPAGAYSGSVTYSAIGPEDGGGTLTRTAPVNVTATIQNCNTPPVFSGLTNVTAEAAGSSGAVVTFTANATDAEDGTIAGTCTPASGSTFPIGTTTVSCQATDSGGLTGHGSFNVIIQDTTAPVLVVPGDITAEATSASGAVVNYTASASDTVDGAVTPSCVPASGSTFALDSTTTVNCSATDAHGNTSTGSFKVKVVDTTAPALTLPADIGGIEATGPGGAAVTFAVSATDLVDGSVTPSCDHSSGSTFAVGTTTVKCSATDAHGNTGTNSFQVKVVDTTPPIVTVPADMTVEATGPSGAVVNYTASASDTVDGAVTPSCAPASGSTFGFGTTTVKCSATDAHGNTGSKSFKVTVQDTTGPTIDAHADVTVTATSPSGAVVNYTSPATHDAVDGAGTATCTPLSGSTFAIGNTTVTCNATDAHGNAATPTTFVVHVVYNWTGFFQPVDNNGVFNTVKAGSAIPIKFNLGGNQGLSIFKTGYPLSARIPCNATAPTDLIEETVTAGSSSLTYDTTAQQYVYVWKTDKAWAGTCRVFDLGLNDGTSHTAYFNFTK